MRKRPCCRIVLTGGPGGGKTTAADLFRRELGTDVVVVPEAATMLFQGGFPRYPDLNARKSSQQAIYHVQRNLEDVQFARYRDRILLCDRGTVDSAAYWPDKESDFFKKVGTTLTEEFDRYDAVIFFESAAVGGIGIEGGNPSRIENLNEALILDKKLREIWSQHTHFYFIPHTTSFFKKMEEGLKCIQKAVNKYKSCKI